MIPFVWTDSRTARDLGYLLKIAAQECTAYRSFDHRAGHLEEAANRRHVGGEGVLDISAENQFALVKERHTVGNSPDG